MSPKCPARESRDVRGRADFGVMQRGCAGGSGRGYYAPGLRVDVPGRPSLGCSRPFTSCGPVRCATNGCERSCLCGASPRLAGRACARGRQDRGAMDHQGTSAAPDASRGCRYRAGRRRGVHLARAADRAGHPVRERRRAPRAASLPGSGAARRVAAAHRLDARGACHKLAALVAEPETSWTMNRTPRTGTTR